MQQLLWLNKLSMKSAQHFINASSFTGLNYQWQIQSVQPGADEPPHRVNILISLVFNLNHAHEPLPQTLFSGSVHGYAIFLFYHNIALWPCSN